MMLQLASVDPNFEVRSRNTPLNPPFKGGKFSSPPLKGELEGVKLDLLSLAISGQLIKNIGPLQK